MLFTRFIVKNDGRSYLFPDGYYERTGDKITVMGMDGRPYLHPFVYSDGILDIQPTESIDDVLRCPSRLPVHTYPHIEQLRIG
ncbi:MAG: hypothetical protein ACOCWQ_04740 [Nanoarchaeota archaeon]